MPEAVSFVEEHPLIKKWAVPRIFGKGPIAGAVQSNSELAKQMFKTPVLCTNPVFAFCYRTVLEKLPGLEFERTFLECDDGGTVGMDKVQVDKAQRKPTDDKPIVLIFPSMRSNTYTAKIQTQCTAYLGAGYQDIFVCNYRGKCNTPLKTLKFSAPYGADNDVHTFVDYVVQCYGGERKILLNGSSMGALFIMDYLSGSGRFPVPEQVLGGVVHSVVWNVGVFYTDHILYTTIAKPQALSQKKYLLGRKKGAEYVGGMTLEKLGRNEMEELSALSLEDSQEFQVFIETLLRHDIHDGFKVKDAVDYAHKTSPSQKVGAIKRPLIIINADDDPSALISEIDIKKIESDLNICLWLFKTGGHLGYIKQMFPRVESFINEVVTECSDIISSSEAGV